MISYSFIHANQVFEGFSSSLNPCDDEDVLHINIGKDMEANSWTSLF